MKELNIDVKEFKPSEAVSKISKLKEDGIRADDYIKRGRIFGESQYENMCKSTHHTKRSAMMKTLWILVSCC